MSSNKGPYFKGLSLEDLKRLGIEEIEERQTVQIIRIYGHQHQNYFKPSISYEPKVIPIKRIYPELQVKNDFSLLDVAKSISAYFNLVSKLTILNLREWAINSINYCKITMKDHVTSKDFPVEKWEKELDRMNQQLINKLALYFEEGEKNLNETMQEILEQEKESLQPLEEFYYNPEAGQPNFLVNLQESLAELQEQIKGDFKNSNRITYKLMQDFQQQLEEFGQMSDEDQESKIEEVKLESMKNIQQMKLVAIEIFDMLDLVYQATLKVNETKWSNEIEKAILKIMSLLEAHGIVEIPVLGQVVDGKTMDTIGTVSQHELSDSIEKYQVFAVHQRGFMDKSTGKVLRKASVTTVL
ncbi:nucleotide exchange factor GrpE [Bacillus sp. AK128]